MDQLSKLHTMLSRIPLTDEEIAGDLQLSDSGIRRIGKKLGLDEKGVQLLFAQLKTKLRDETDDEPLSENIQEDDRFTYTSDFMANVTIQDAKTGKSVFLQGTKASAFLNRVKTGDEQAIMAAYAGLMEGEEDHWKALEKTGFFGKQGAGCLVLATSTGRILIAHRSELAPPYNVEQPGTYVTWGGAIEEGEDPKTAVIRELHEEAGYHGAIAKMVPLLVFQKGSFRYYNFLAVVSEEFEPHLNWESQGYRWCEFGKWPRPLHFGLAALLSDKASVAKIKTQLDDRPLDEDAELLPYKVSDSFDAEIESNTGTFNFPWSIGSRHGFACARFTGRGPAMTIVILWASDQGGHSLDIKPLADELAQQARDFIGQE